MSVVVCDNVSTSNALLMLWNV